MSHTRRLLFLWTDGNTVMPFAVLMTDASGDESEQLFYLSIVQAIDIHILFLQRILSSIIFFSLTYIDQVIADLQNDEFQSNKHKFNANFLHRRICPYD